MQYAGKLRVPVIYPHGVHIRVRARKALHFVLVQSEAHTPSYVFARARKKPALYKSARRRRREHRFWALLYMQQSACHGVLRIFKACIFVTKNPRAHPHFQNTFPKYMCECHFRIRVANVCNIFEACILNWDCGSRT